MSSALPSAVLDTNTVLDWLVFRDPAALALARELESDRIVWRASAAMRREFDQVLPRAALSHWQPDAAVAAAAWDRYARLEPAEPPACRLNCRDADDQVFIDLALHLNCTWLLTRDRALLDLARRAAMHGVAVLSPQTWLKMHAMQAPTDADAARTAQT